MSKNVYKHSLDRIWDKQIKGQIFTKGIPLLICYPELMFVSDLTETLHARVIFNAEFISDIKIGISIILLKISGGVGYLPILGFFLLIRQKCLK